MPFSRISVFQIGCSVNTMLPCNSLKKHVGIASNTIQYSRAGIGIPKVFKNSAYESN